MIPSSFQSGLANLLIFVLEDGRIMNLTVEDGSTNSSRKGH
jgi:hypothetical protein